MDTPGAEIAPLQADKPAIVAGPAPCTDWQAELRRALRSASAVRAAVGLPTAPDVDLDFPVLAPWPMLSRVQRGNPDDPILRQLLSSPEELQLAEGDSSDPLQEAEATPQPGLIHKYPGRALLIATGACAVHCRYCFRRTFPYAQHASGRLSAALAHLEAATDIREVILSGGDPLSLDDERLLALLERLAALPQLKTIRLHTRLPIAIPARITPTLLAGLGALKPRLVVVVHANHAQELDAAVLEALRALTGVACVLNQSVLLQGVNADAHSLAALSERLFDAGVLPYYLHQLDRVTGAAHFAVDDTTARRIHGELQAQLPGYLVPRLVREIPGVAHKVLLT